MCYGKGGALPLRTGACCRLGCAGFVFVSLFEIGGTYSLLMQLEWGNQIEMSMFVRDIWVGQVYAELIERFDIR